MTFSTNTDSNKLTEIVDTYFNSVFRSSSFSSYSYHTELQVVEQNSLFRFWPCRLGQQNTLIASLLRGKTPPMSVLDMTLNNLMARLQ